MEKVYGYYGYTFCSLLQGKIIMRELWLSEKLGRTPFSVACKIASQRHLTNGWKEQFREVSDKIRLSGLSISDYLKQNGTGHNA